MEDPKEILIKRSSVLHCLRALGIGLVISVVVMYVNRLIPLNTPPVYRIPLAFGFLTGVWFTAWMLRAELLTGWKWLTERGEHKRIWPVGAVLLIWVIVGVGLIKYTPLIRQDEPTGDEPEYIMLSRSLLDDRDFNLEVDQATGVCQEFMSGPFSLRGRSLRPPGLPVLLMPAYLWGRHMPWPGLPCSLYLWMGLLYVWLGMEIFLLFQMATNRPRLAWFGTFVALMLPPLAPYAFQVYPEIPAALLVFRLFRREFYGDNDRNRFSDGICLALIPVFHQKYMFLFVMSGIHLLFGVYMHRRRQILDWLALILPGAFSLVALSLFFGHRFSIWLPTAPYSLNENLLNHLLTLHTLKVTAAQFLDRKWGLLMVCPLLVFSLSGIVALWRRRPWVWVWWFTTCGGFIVLLSAYNLWWGGFSPPGRFLLPVVPLLWFGAVQFWARNESQRPMNVIGLVILFGLSFYFSYLVFFGTPYEHQTCSPFLYPEESPNGSALWAAVSPAIDWNEVFPAVERNARWNHILPDALRFNIVDGVNLTVWVLFLLLWIKEASKNIGRISQVKTQETAQISKFPIKGRTILALFLTALFFLGIEGYSNDQQYIRYRYISALQAGSYDRIYGSIPLEGAYGTRTGAWRKAPEAKYGIYYPPVYIQDMPDTLWPGGYDYTFRIPVWWESTAETGVVVFTVENRITRVKNEARFQKIPGIDRGELQVTIPVPEGQNALFKLVMYGDRTAEYSYQVPALSVEHLQ